jgi:hypothetical protein
LSGFKLNPLSATLDRVEQGAQATKALKLIVEYDTDINTQPGDLVRVSGNNQVTKINSNSSVEIPKGIFGVVASKLSPTRCEVIFLGIQDGYSGFTTGDALFVQTDGTLGHNAPNTGTVQQIGFAVSPSEIFINIKQALRRD